MGHNTFTQTRAQNLNRMHFYLYLHVLIRTAVQEKDSTVGDWFEAYISKEGDTFIRFYFYVIM